MTNRIKITSTRVRTNVSETTGPFGRYDEDGQPYLRYEVYVEAHTEDGLVYVHPQLTLDLADDLNATREPKLRDAAEAIEAAGTIDPELWVFSRHSYGSEGWEEQERHNQREDDRREAFDDVHRISFGPRR